MRRRPHAGPAGPIVWRVALGLLVAPAPTLAQQVAPVVGPPALPTFPTFEERTLSSGPDVLIVTDSLLPWVDVSLILPGGRAADRDGMSGTAELVARLITTGTDRHSVAELAEALDRSAVNLAAVVGTDWMTVSLGSLTTQLDSALSLLADVVLRPSFPQTEIQRVRRQRVVALQTAWMEPRAMASRAFRKAVYGTHPYGAYESPEGVRDLTADDLREYHRRVFRPDGAVFLVSGHVDPDDIRSRLEAYFSEWDRPDGPRPSLRADGDRAGIAGPGVDRTASVIVHTPGSTRAAIRMGHTLAAGDSPDWPGLLLLGQILGGGPDALLGARARSRGWAGAAVATLNRRRGPGLLEIDLDVRVELADSAVVEIVTLLEQLRSEAPGIEETQALQGRAAAALPLQLSTARQVVGQIGRTRLLADVTGESSGLLTEYASALAAQTPEGLRRVASEHLRPAQVSVVVVGDARLLRPRLAALGPVRMVDADGGDLDLADLTPAVTPLTTDASSLGSGRWQYRVSAGGEVAGEMVRTLSVDAGGVGLYSLSSSTTVGPQTLVQEVTFDGGEFRPLSASFEFTQGAQQVGARIALAEGRVSGSRTLPDGRTEPFDTPFVPGALVGEMLEVAVWMADLREGLELVLPVVQVESGATAYVRVRVLDRTRVTVPAGRYDAYRIEIEGAQAPQLVYARVRAPHVIVKLETPGQPFVIELEAEGPGGGGGGG